MYAMVCVLLAVAASLWVIGDRRQAVEVSLRKWAGLGCVPEPSSRFDSGIPPSV